MFESEHFKKQAGLLTFTPSVSEWVEQTGAMGLFVKRGRYGGTFAHKDIAFEFASAISPVFKLYLIKEFQRLKEQENNLQKIEWDAKRFLAKNNYLIQTDAVKNYLISTYNYREDPKPCGVRSVDDTSLNCAQPQAAEMGEMANPYAMCGPRRAAPGCRNEADRHFQYNSG